MSSHDYRWLAGSIAAASRDDHERQRSAAEQRSWAMIEHENELREDKRERVARAREQATPAALTPAAHTEQPAPMPTVTSSGEAGLHNFHDGSAGGNVLVKPGDPVLRLSHLVDPSPYLPGDAGRPFTSVHLVALNPQPDWSALKKRAARISDLRKAQLSHAYQVDPAAGISGAQQRLNARRQNKLDRKRMQQHDREKRDADRIALQKASSMVLSPPLTESEGSSDDDDDPALRFGILAGYNKKGPARHADSESDDDDGPPPDAEEIVMRMQRAAWRRTRDTLGRAVHSLSGTKSPPGAGSRTLPMSPQNGGRRGPVGNQRQSIMISNDRRVQGVYASATNELQVKNSIEHKEAVEIAKWEQIKEEKRRAKAYKILQIKEVRRKRRQMMEDTAPSMRKATFGHAVAMTPGARILDRSDSHDHRSPSPERLSRSQSALSLVQSRVSNSLRHQSSADSSQPSSPTKSLAHSDSAPVISIAGHIIKPSTPSRWPKTPATPAGGLQTVPDESSPSIPDHQSSSGSLLGGLNTPLLARRRARGVLPLPIGLTPALPRSPGIGESSGSESETPNTFLTQTPGSSPVFSVPEYSPSSPPFGASPTTLFPTRSVRQGIMPQQVVTNVLSPIQHFPPPPRPGSSGFETHSLKGDDILHRPTLLQPISSLVRSFTGNPLDHLSTAIVGRASSETEKVIRGLQANLEAADQEIQHMLTSEQKTRTRTAELALLNDDPFAFLRATAPVQVGTPRLALARKRAGQSDLASKIMMSFSHEDMRKISDEIERSGDLTCADFIRTTRRKKKGDQDYEAETEALAEMFQEIDVNGDQSLSFLEFTSYLVELAHTQFQSSSSQDDKPAFTTYQPLDEAPALNDDDLDFTSIKWFDALDSFVACEKDQVRFKVLNKALRLTKIVRGHSLPILALEYLPFHQLLVTSSLDNTMKFWSCDWDRDGKQKEYEQMARLGTGKETLSLPGLGFPANDISSKRVKSKLKSPLVPTYAEIATWNTPLPQYGLTWNKTRLYSSDASGRIVIWNVDSGSTIKSLMGHDDKVNAMLPIPDMLASASDDCTVRIWDNTHSTEVACLRKHQRSVRTLCYSPACSMLATGGDDDYVRLWDVATHKQVSSFTFDQGWFKTLPGCEPDTVVSMEAIDNKLLVGSRRGAFRLYDLRMLVPLQTFQLPDVDDDALIQAAAEAADESSKRKPKKLHSHGTGHEEDDEPETEMERMRRRTKIQLTSFCIFRDEALMAAHDAKVKEAQRERDEERARILEAGLSADALPETIVEPPKDPRCQLVIASSGRHLHRFGKGGSITRTISHDEPILHSEFNANSLTIFTASAKHVKIWCCLTGRLVREYPDLLVQEHTGSGGVPHITSACLDQRQRKFILGSNLGDTYVFNYNTGQCMHKLSNTALPASGARRFASEVQHLNCIINSEYQHGVAEPTISIHFVHSTASTIFLHVDDPDHLRKDAAGGGGSDAAKAKELADAMAPPRTVLHSLTSHKQDITCIAISEKFGLIMSGSVDCSIVCYPWELAGSPTQRIIPGEALHAIALAQAAPGSTVSPLQSFKSPILSVIILHPFKIMACSDSLGYVFFYYFNRTHHALIGILRNSKKLDSLNPDAVETKPTPKKGRHRSSSRHGRSTSAASDADDPLSAAKRAAMIDFPPVLNLVYDAKSTNLYTSDDLGFVKGWQLNGALFSPHIEEYRARKWNDFASRAPSKQRPPRLQGSMTHVLSYKQDDHELLTAEDIQRVFHSRHPETASSLALRMRPFFVIQAHNGACHGVQLIEADAGLQSRFEAAAAAEALEMVGATAGSLMASTHQTPQLSPFQSKRSSIVTREANLLAAQNPLKSAITSPVNSGKSSRVGSSVSRAMTPGFSAKRTSEPTEEKSPEKGDKFASAIAQGIQKRELDAANLRRWEEQEWDEDTDESDGDGLLPLADGRSNGQQGPYRDARDLPDHPRGQGRRTSIALELVVNKPVSKAMSRKMSAQALRLAIAAQKPPPEPVVGPRHVSGECLLTYGSDGCVHIYSLTTHKCLATLMQGYTTTNCKETPGDWRFAFPVHARQARDEGLLEDLIEEVEESERAVRDAALKEALAAAARKAEEAKSKRRSRGGSHRSSLRMGEQKLLSPPNAFNAELAKADSDGEAADEAPTREEKQEAAAVPLILCSPESLADAREHEQATREFVALENNIRHVMRKEKRQQERKHQRTPSGTLKLLRNASSGEVHQLVAPAPTITPAQTKEMQAQRTMLTSKSMSALTPSLYIQAGGPGLTQFATSPLSTSASAVSLHSMPGVGAIVPPPTASTSKRFTSIDTDATWRDYDGTIRTLDDPLDYRFSVDRFLADVAARHTTQPLAAAAAVTISPDSRPRTLSVDTRLARQRTANEPTSGVLSASDHTDSATAAPDTAGTSDLDSGGRSVRTSSRSTRRSPSSLRDPRQLSFSSPINEAQVDADLVSMQRRTLERVRAVQMEEARQDRKRKARAQAVLQATLDREKEIKAQMQVEDRKLSPRSAECVRARLLLSRKPTNFVNQQLESLGMRMTEAPRARRHRNAFGEVTEAKESSSTGQLRRHQVAAAVGPSTFKRASMDGKSFAQAIAAAQQANASGKEP